MTRRSGFTLLEVMIAVAILALALTSIFSSEVVSHKVGFRARNLTLASLLARCKMGEIEEQIAKDGLPAVESSGNDACCEDAEHEGFTCEWTIERVVLPEDLGMTEGEGGEGEGGGAAGLLAGAAEGETPSMDEILSGAAGGGGDIMAEMAMTMALPILKPSIEEQVRRATVKVQWREGDRTHEFEVVQFLVAEPPPAVSDPTQNPDPGGGP